MVQLSTAGLSIVVVNGVIRLIDLSIAKGAYIRSQHNWSLSLVSFMLTPLSSSSPLFSFSRLSWITREQSQWNNWMCSFKTYGKCLVRANKPASKHTHAHVRCSHTSVELTQAVYICTTCRVLTWRCSSHQLNNNIWRNSSGIQKHSTYFHSTITFSKCVCSLIKSNKSHYIYMKDDSTRAS